MICVVEENKEAQKEKELQGYWNLIRKHDASDKGGESKSENLGEDHPSRIKCITKDPKLEPCLVSLKNNIEASVSTRS